MRFTFNSVMTIKEIRPDCRVLMIGNYIVGVVAVKTPGYDVLLENTVLGELLDQMLLVEGFCRMGPVIGILTTAEEWLISWFPEDLSALKQTTYMIQSQASLTTLYPSYTEPAHTRRCSPLGSPTPTQLSDTAHTIHLAQAIPPSSDLDLSETAEVLVADEQIRRVLCTTEVLNVHKNPILVLQHLCSAFKMMSSSYIHQHPNTLPCLFKFHKSISTITYHPITTSIPHTTNTYTMINFDKYRHNSDSNVNTLIAIEDLGRCSTGKAWLCMTNIHSHPPSATTTAATPTVCVLKFNNYDGRSVNLLVHEKEMWDLLYPELTSMIRMEVWSGAYALVMPYFSTILEQERVLYKDAIYEVTNEA